MANLYGPTRGAGRIFVTENDMTGSEVTGFVRDIMLVLCCAQRLSKRDIRRRRNIDATYKEGN